MDKRQIFLGVALLFVVFLVGCSVKEGLVATRDAITGPAGETIASVATTAGGILSVIPGIGFIGSGLLLAGNVFQFLRGMTTSKKYVAGLHGANDLISNMNDLRKKIMADGKVDAADIPYLLEQLHPDKLREYLADAQEVAGVISAVTNDVHALRQSGKLETIKAE